MELVQRARRKNAVCDRRYILVSKHLTVTAANVSSVILRRQTETGSIVVTPFPGAIETKPGSATVPFFGIEPAILDPITGKVISLAWIVTS